MFSAVSLNPETNLNKDFFEIFIVLVVKGLLRIILFSFATLLTFGYIADVRGRILLSIPCLQKATLLSLLTEVLVNPHILLQWFQVQLSFC